MVRSRYGPSIIETRESYKGKRSGERVAVSEKRRKRSNHEPRVGRPVQKEGQGSNTLTRCRNQRLGITSIAIERDDVRKREGVTMTIQVRKIAFKEVGRPIITRAVSRLRDTRWEVIIGKCVSGARGGNG